MCGRLSIYSQGEGEQLRRVRAGDCGKRKGAGVVVQKREIVNVGGTEEEDAGLGREGVLVNAGDGEGGGGEGRGRCVMECGPRGEDDGYVQRCPSSARNISRGSTLKTARPLLCINCSLAHSYLHLYTIRTFEPPSRRTNSSARK